MSLARNPCFVVSSTKINILRGFSFFRHLCLSGILFEIGGLFLLVGCWAWYRGIHSTSTFFHIDFVFPKLWSFSRSSAGFSRNREHFGVGSEMHGFGPIRSHRSGLGENSGWNCKERPHQKRKVQFIKLLWGAKKRFRLFLCPRSELDNLARQSQPQEQKNLTKSRGLISAKGKKYPADFVPWFPNKWGRKGGFFVIAGRFHDRLHSKGNAGPWGKILAIVGEFREKTKHWGVWYCYQNLIFLFLGHIA